MTEPEFASAFLRKLLAGGAKPAARIVDEASRNGISERTLWRGKKLAGVQSFRKGFSGGAWYWRLIENPSPK